MKATTIAVTAASLAATSAAPIDIIAWGADKLDQLTLNIGQLAKGEAFPWPPTKPLVETEALQAYITEAGLAARVDKLFTHALKGVKKYGHPTRVIGSAGHYATLGDIESSIRKLGPYYNVTKQHFHAPSGAIFNSSLTVDGVLVEDAKAFDLTPPTLHRQPVTAPLVLVSNQGCDLADFPAEVNGSIALISRGICAFGSKSELAGQAGAVGAVIYNDKPGEGVIQATMGNITPNQVATVGVSYEEGSKWAEALGSESFNASLWIDSYVKNASTWNIIAETTLGDKENVVMLGAHSDSVAAGPGINDDGSGTISLLEIATALTHFNVTNQVRFAWWAGEEEGLLGSDYYVKTLTPGENEKIRLFMDYDMMASPNYAYQVYDANNTANPNGSGELKQLYIDYYTEHGVNYTLIPFDGRSDYDGFIKNGIPGGGIATGAEVLKTEKEVELFGGVAGIPFDPCYHQLCDNTTNLAYDAFVLNTKLIAHSVATYGASLEGFPVRELPKYEAKTNAFSIYKGPKIVA